MPTETRDSAGVYKLTAPGQMVVFDPEHPVIGIHSAEPMFEHRARPCEYLCGDGYCDASFFHGAALKEQWASSSDRDRLVWGELHRWFDSYFN